MKQRNNAKALAGAILVLALCAAALTGCGSQKLSDDFDKAALEEAAGAAIHAINEKDAAALRDMCNVRMRDALTDDVLAQVFEAIGEGGAFQEVSEISMAGSKDKETEEEYAVVVAKAKYENRNFTYTLSFTKQMKLAGLYYK